MEGESGDSRRASGARRLTLRQIAAAYTPTRLRDMLFLHGIALSAARQAIRDDQARLEEQLYVPREWADAYGGEAAEAND